jgi:amino-acid N-acetyltransferase
MYKSLNIGRRMVSYLIERATTMKLKAVFVLTTQASDWFSQIGFLPITLAELPREKQKKYNRKRNALILRYRLSGHKARGAVRVV